MEKVKFIGRDELRELIERIGNVYLPQKKDEHFNWEKYPCNFSLEGFRTVIPPKFFFYPPQETLVETKKEKLTIVGIKACDLRAIKFLRKVFKEGDFIDPFFREDIFIISSDCTYVSENCFCGLLGDKPYSEDGFDLNLSEISDGFIVEIGTDRGGELVKTDSDLFADAKDEQLEERRQNREKTLEQIKGKMIETDKINLKKIEADSEKCVSCSACTMTCPSCFCFILGEQKNFIKTRIWDSCQYPGYARVAGGLNPRKELKRRFLHRLKCKFFYSVERFNSRSCFGCGRCISACFGGINLKDALQPI